MNDYIKERGMGRAAKIVNLCSRLRRAIKDGNQDPPFGILATQLSI